MLGTRDGPGSALFRPLPLRGNVTLSELGRAGTSREMTAALEHAPTGECTGWGIPFVVDDPVALIDQVVTIPLEPTLAPWLVFMHTSDLRPVVPGSGGTFSPMRGEAEAAPCNCLTRSAMRF